MLKSLYSGVSGMQGFQTKLDTIGNNIANVNTVGFKKSRVMFQDIINQNLSGPTAPTATHGGVNPKQVGLGSTIASIDTIHTPGSPMTTNVGTDLAIGGDAYFVVNDPNTKTNYLTKAGNFSLDANGNLVTSNGLFVAGVYGSGTPPQQAPIKINKDDVTGQPFTSFSIDTNGNINVVGTDSTGKNTISGKLAYDGTNYTIDTTNSSPNDISIATAVVANPEGMEKVGSTMFKTNGASGAATIGPISKSGGQINAGELEMSNVDLTEEFTEMIVAQRGFQANAKTITTSDQILQDIVNLKQ